jgi:hypothetical protein
MTAPRDFEAHDFDLKTYCDRLPDPAPPAALHDATLRAFRRRRTRRTALLATAAGVAFGAIGMAGQRLLAPGAPAPHMPPPASVAASTVPPAGARTDALRDIDRSLQAAYDAGASDAEVAVLWAQRRALAGRDADSVPLSL